MSGTVSMCLQQQFDQFGNLLIGGLVYTFQAGTTTPQSAYRDAGLGAAWPNPVPLDASARVPQMFFADGVIRIRITDAGGVQQLDADALPVIGSSGGSVPVSPTDPNALYATGDLKVRYGTGVLSGYVRGNGGGIGNAGSGGASERANVDTQSLFTYLWNLNDPDLTVSGGRGASALADFTALKSILLPDFRGTLIGALDDMGALAGASGRLSAANWSALAGSKNPTTLGAFAGADHNTTANMPAHQHPAFIGDDGHKHSSAAAFSGVAVTRTSLDTTVFNGASSTDTSTNSTGVKVRSTAGNAATADNQTGSAGSATAPALPPMRLVTVYIRL